MNDLSAESPLPTQPITPNALETKTAKELQWQTVNLKFSKIKDRRGKPIEPGILETVVAFNVNGINTVQSCEGHTDGNSIGGPWISIEAKDTNRLAKKSHRVYRRVEAVEDRLKDPPNEYTKRLRERARSLGDRLTAVNLNETNKAADLLAEFYKDRGDNTPADRRLHLNIAFNGMGLIENQGAQFLKIRALPDRQLKLAEYQEEMRAFTEFLKAKFFSS